VPLTLNDQRDLRGATSLEWAVVENLRAAEDNAVVSNEHVGVHVELLAKKVVDLRDTPTSRPEDVPYILASKRVARADDVSRAMARYGLLVLAVAVMVRGDCRRFELANQLGMAISYCSSHHMPLDLLYLSVPVSRIRPAEQKYVLFDPGILTPSPHPPM
jgi:hypothetical protein